MEPFISRIRINIYFYDNVALKAGASTILYTPPQEASGKETVFLFKKNVSQDFCESIGALSALMFYTRLVDCICL